KKKGIKSMHTTSEICESDSKMFGCWTPNELGKVPLKLARNGPPKALVICSAAPSSIEKIKNTAIFRSLNKTKASSPMADIQDSCFLSGCGGVAGIARV